MAVGARTAGAGLVLATLLLPGLAAAGAPPSPDPSFLRAQWQRQAEAGDGQAAYRLGLMFDLGQGVAPDAAAALRWYEKAGAAGFAEGAFNAAVMLDDGQSVGRDRAQAAWWYARAAVRGHARAALNLARMFEAGDGVPRSQSAALAWLQMAAPSIPVARARLRVLQAEHVQPPSGEAAAAPPAPAQPIQRPGPRPTELVWLPASGAGAANVSYVLSLAVPGQGGWVPVATQRTALTASAATGAPATGCYAWRVYSVSPDSAHYAASPWQRVGCPS